jgi:hypothetical protein
MHLGRKLLHTANDQLEFTLQRLGLGQLLTLGFDLRNALTQSDHARLEFRLFNQALGIAIDEPCQALAELARLMRQGGTLLALSLAIGVEAAGTLLGQPFGVRQEGTHFLPYRQLEAIRPHLGVGTEAVAAKAIRIRADIAVIGLGPGPTFPCTGTQGFAVEGIPAVLTLTQALQQIACPTPGLAGMPAVFLHLLLHCGEHRGLDDGGHRDVHPVWGRDIIVRRSPPWLQRSAPLRPQFGAQRPLPGLPKGRAAHIRRIFQDCPDHTPLPSEAACARPFARLHEPATDVADRTSLTAAPREDLVDHTGLIRDEVIVCVAPTVMLGDGAVALWRATEHLDRPHPGRMEFAPSVAFNHLGPFVLGHHPWHLEPQSIFRATPSFAVEDDDLHAKAPQFVNQ